LPLTSSLSGKRPPVLLVEDERGLADEIDLELQRLGHPVIRVDSVEEGLHAARKGDAAILIMDRMLKGVDGLAMVETLRKEGIKTPVLFISALSSIDERIRGLNAGGDDYLIKPFAMAELSARVDALLRRLDDVRTTKLRVGDLEMDLLKHQVVRGGTEIDLLPREFKLLEYFMRHPGQVVTRTMLLEDVWRYRFAPDTNVVDVHIGNLRRKIDAGGEKSLIASIRGAGFMLNGDS
jgi:two-component system OmpR family response regulator